MSTSLVLLTLSLLLPVPKNGEPSPGGGIPEDDGQPSKPPPKPPVQKAPIFQTPSQALVKATAEWSKKPQNARPPLKDFLNQKSPTLLPELKGYLGTASGQANKVMDEDSPCACVVMAAFDPSYIDLAELDKAPYAITSSSHEKKWDYTHEFKAAGAAHSASSAQYRRKGGVSQSYADGIGRTTLDLQLLCLDGKLTACTACKGRLDVQIDYKSNVFAKHYNTGNGKWRAQSTSSDHAVLKFSAVGDSADAKIVAEKQLAVSTDGAGGFDNISGTEGLVKALFGVVPPIVNLAVNPTPTPADKKALADALAGLAAQEISFLFGFLRYAGRASAEASHSFALGYTSPAIELLPNVPMLFQLASIGETKADGEHSTLIGDSHGLHMEQRYTSGERWAGVVHQYNCEPGIAPPKRFALWRALTRGGIDQTPGMQPNTMLQSVAQFIKVRSGVVLSFDGAPYTGFREL